MMCSGSPLVSRAPTGVTAALCHLNSQILCACLIQFIVAKIILSVLGLTLLNLQARDTRSTVAESEKHDSIKSTPRLDIFEHVSSSVLC